LSLHELMSGQAVPIARLRSWSCGKFAEARAQGSANPNFAVQPSLAKAYQGWERSDETASIAARRR
jgi:hypothetical protein